MYHIEFILDIVLSSDMDINNRFDLDRYSYISSLKYLAELERVSIFNNEDVRKSFVD